jgi:glycosyltransferase involved in cell wall biosynthesis
MISVCFIDRLGSPYDGSTPSKRALGGSESAVVFAAHELRKLGISVVVYNDCEGLDARPGNYDGVDYRPYHSIELYSDWFDVAIVSRSTVPFANGISATHKVLWLHDTFCEGDNELESFVVQGKIDELWTLSDWHTTYISQCTHGHRRMMEVLKRKIWVTRNGVTIYRDVIIKDKDPNKFIFNAAVSKGMETLLNDVWPRVKKQIPSAHLEIIGGAYPLKEKDDQGNKLEELMALHHNKNDVSFSGLITQSEVANRLASASFFIYPQSFPETYGISTVESLAYGTPLITGRFGAMEETAIEDACYLMDYPVDSNVLYTFDREAHLTAFVNLVVRSWDDQYLHMQKANAALKVREVCGWDKVVLQWRQHLYKKLGLYMNKWDYVKVQQINHRTHELFNKRWSNPEEWAYYPESERHLQVIVPFYNSFQYLEKCIESIVSQNYENYNVVLIDDCSDDCTLEDIKKLASKKGLYSVKVVKNKKRVGALSNQVRTIKYMSKRLKDSVVVLIDGDDALVNDPNVFKKINREYAKGAEMTYGSFWSMVDSIPCIAQEYPEHVHKAKSYRTYRFPWNIPYSHLRTFTVDLFNRIDDSDLRDADGLYFKAGGDSALFYALMEKVYSGRAHPIRDILYLYNDLNPLNDYKVNSPEQVKNTATILANNKTQEKYTLVKTKIDPKPVYDLPKKRILIAIPTDRNIHPETFKSIYELEVPSGYETYFQFFYGYAVDQVRNLIAHWAIQNHFDYVFSVDYDISFPKDTLEKLLSHDKDIVSGLYRQRKMEQILEIYRESGVGHYNVPINELTEPLSSIDGCGFGCVLVKTEVYKTIGYPQFKYQSAIEMKDTLSEDVWFCMQAKAKGFTIWADTTIKCGHHGQIEFRVVDNG